MPSNKLSPPRRRGPRHLKRLDSRLRGKDDIIPLHVPEIGGRAWEYVKECLDTGWVSSVGSFVTRFETEFAAFVGASGAVGVVNGTSALHAALLAVGVQPGDEVLVSDLTFIAPVNAIRYCGAFPVFIDADARSWQMDAAKVERFFRERCEKRGDALINKKSGRRVRAIVPVHILGFACDIERIVLAAAQSGVKVVEDAAEALGVRVNGKHVGMFGDAAAFSFNGNKIMTTGGGGMVIARDPAVLAKVRYLTTQAKDDELEYVHNHVGYNYRLTNLQAALGVAQLEQMPSFIERKAVIGKRYLTELTAAGLQTLEPFAGVSPTYWLNTFLLPRGTSIDQRKRFIRSLIERRIGARPLWHTIHDLPVSDGFEAYEIENSLDIYRRSVSLPSSAALTDRDFQTVVDTVRSLLS